MSRNRRSLLIVGGINDYPTDLTVFEELWCINNSFKRFDSKRVDRVFYFDNHSLIDPDFVKNVNALDHARVITRWPDAELPRSESYPVDDVIRHFGQAYFTCSFAYCLALALYEGFTDVTLAGCYHVEDSFEYMQHKPCVEFWLGRMLGSGVNVNIHGHSMLLKPHTWESEVYGFETNEFRRLFIETMAGAYAACSIYPMQIRFAKPPHPEFEMSYKSLRRREMETLPVLDEVLT